MISKIIFTSTIDKKPRFITLLIFLFLYLLFYLLIALSFIDLFYGFILFMMIIIPTVLFLILIWFVTGKIKMSRIIQWLLYLIPFIGILTLTYVFPKKDPPNQTQSLKSPNGQYVITVPIERNPKHNNEYVWKVTIKDNQGKTLYQDRESGFLGRFSVYWVWDQFNNLWLYNSDDGHIYFWVHKNNSWNKSVWGFEGTFADEGWKMHKKVTDTIFPPDILFPERVRKHLENED